MRYMCDRCGTEIKRDVVRGFTDATLIRVMPEKMVEAPYEFAICMSCSNEFWDWIKPKGGAHEAAKNNK